MNYEKSPNETEILSADEQKLREICCSLKKIDAPKDFDFKLKARIANTNAGRFQPRFGPAFRYALPALALVLVLGLLAYNGGFLSANNNPLAAASAPAPQAPAAAPQNTAVSGFSPTPQNADDSLSILPPHQNLPKVPENETAGRIPKKSEPGKKVKAENENSTTSEDKTFRSIEVLNPKGFEQKAPPQNLQNPEKPNPLPVREIFSQMGINAALENGKWTVKSVTANGFGESSGVRENDVIEAIDNQPLSAETVFDKIVNGKIITITRKGEKLQIKLRNKQ